MMGIEPGVIGVKKFESAISFSIWSFLIDKSINKSIIFDIDFKNFVKNAWWVSINGISGSGSSNMLSVLRSDDRLLIYWSIDRYRFCKFGLKCMMGIDHRVIGVGELEYAILSAIRWSVIDLLIDRSISILKIWSKMHDGYRSRGYRGRGARICYLLFDLMIGNRVIDRYRFWKFPQISVCGVNKYYYDYKYITNIIYSPCY